MNLKTGRRKGNKVARLARARLNQIPLPSKPGGRTSMPILEPLQRAADDRDGKVYPGW